jgi:hypothetical protein
MSSYKVMPWAMKLYDRIEECWRLGYSRSDAGNFESAAIYQAGSIIAMALVHLADVIKGSEKK